MAIQNNLNKQINIICNEYENLINNLIHNVLINGTVLCLNTNLLKIGFKDLSEDLNITFELLNSDKNINQQLKINISSANSFILEQSNSQILFYTYTTTLLTNTELISNIKNLLIEFNNKINIIISESNNIQINENIKLRLSREQEENQSTFINNEHNIKKLSENLNSDVVIKLYKDKTHNSIFSYRNHPIDIISFHNPATYNAYAETRRMNKHITPYTNYTYKTVDANAIKIN